MQTVDYAKKQLIAVEKKYEEFIQKNSEYQSFISLPWYKRLLTWHPVEKPDFYHNEFITLYIDNHHCVELRMNYWGLRREIVLAINEDYCGFRLDVDTLERKPYLGRVEMEVSEEFMSYVMVLRNQLAPLLVE